MAPAATRRRALKLVAAAALVPVGTVTGAVWEPVGTGTTGTLTVELWPFQAVVWPELEAQMVVVMSTVSVMTGASVVVLTGLGEGVGVGVGVGVADSRPPETL